MTPSSDLSALKIDRGAPATGGPGRRPLVLVLLAVLAVAAVFAYFRIARSATPVQVGSVEATGGGTASGSGISANGYVVARTKASVSAKILGRLAWIGVSEGSLMKTGDVIARLEDSDYRAAVAAAHAGVAQVEAQLAQARRDLVRKQSLRRDSLIADFELETTQTQVKVLAAQLASTRAQADLAEVNLQSTRVVAPFAGTVLRKDAEVGEIVAPSSAGGGLTRTAIVTMADLRTLEVEVDVNEAYIAQVRGGQSARITLDAYPDTSFAGRVRQVVPTADRQKATVLVKVSILDRDPRILPEMGAKVVFDSKGAAASAAPRRVLAPAAAVVQGSGGASVWVVSENVVHRVNVDVGAARGEQVEIRQGLAGGESLVLQPSAKLKDGGRVKVAGR
jgi:RND family efflux transporter MFP subunit